MPRRWLDGARTRLRLMLDRQAAETRMDGEFRFHIDMESEHLMRTRGLDAAEARRQALAAFGGVQKHQEEVRDGRDLAWLGSLSLDLKLGIRMLFKYPGLTFAGGLAITIAIAIGAGWYDMIGKIVSPRIPLPDGDRIVEIAVQNAETTQAEGRILHDFQEWRREVRSVSHLGAYRTDTRNLVVGTSAPEPIQVAEMTVAAFDTARVPPLLGRGLVSADEQPGAPAVIVIGHDVWRRSLEGRGDVLGAIVRLGTTTATVVGVMPEGFGYPFNHDAWSPLVLRAAYAPLEGAPISVIGRLAPGVSLAQAKAEMRAIGQRSAAVAPATHEHLRPVVTRLGDGDESFGATTLAARNVPVLLALAIACMSVGTLIYARTATREGEIAIRAALGASRARVIGQLFIEALVLASIAAGLGLVAADRGLAWGIESVNRASGGAPFWMVPGLDSTTVIYAAGLAIVTAAMLSVLPALRATRTRVQPQLANLGTGRATLRFGRVWTSAMVLQVALTAMGMPAVMESVNQTMRKVRVRAQFPSQEYLSARVDLDRPFADELPTANEQKREAAFTSLARRIEQEPGVIGVAFADRVPGAGGTRRNTSVAVAPGTSPIYDGNVLTVSVTPEFFDTFQRPAIAGRTFHAGDVSQHTRAAVINEAFARELSRAGASASPIGARLRHHNSAVAAAADSESWFEIIGIVRDFDLDPDDEGREQPSVYLAARAGAMSPLFMHVHMRSAPAALAARLPVLATTVDAGILVPEALPMQDWIRDTFLVLFLVAELAVAALVLFLSGLGVFSLASVSVSRRTREIGLRVSLGATPRHIVTQLLSQSVLLMGGGALGGSLLVLVALAFGMGPSGNAVADIRLFSGYLALTSAIMIGACVLACLGPARRALSLNPADALKDC